MSSCYEPPVVAKACQKASAVQRRHSRKEAATSLGSETQCLESRSKKATQREGVLLQQLYEARAYIIKKEKEVCDLQGQLQKELTERQELFYEVFKRDKNILCLQESLADLKAQASDADEKKIVSKAAVQSHSDLNAGRAISLSGTHLNANYVPKACGLILPTFPDQHATFSPQVARRGSWNADKQSTPTNFCSKSPTAPSPTWVIPGEHFNWREHFRGKSWTRSAASVDTQCGKTRKLVRQAYL